MGLGHSSPPEIVDQFLVVVGSAIDRALADETGANLDKIKNKIELAWRAISHLDGISGLAGSTDVMTKDAAVDRTILLELDNTNLGNETLREFV